MKEKPKKCIQPDCSQVVNEISYYLAFICLERLKKQDRIPLKKLREANVAIAVKYGVFPYEV